MLSLCYGRTPLLDARYVEVVGDSLAFEHAGSFVPFGSWSPRHAGFALSERAQEIVALSRGHCPKGVRNLSLAGSQEPLRLSFLDEQGYEHCYFDGHRLELRDERRGWLAIVNAGAVVCRYDPEARLWRLSDRFEPSPRLLVAEWGTPPLHLSFRPAGRRRLSGLSES